MDRFVKAFSVMLLATCAFPAMAASVGQVPNGSVMGRALGDGYGVPKRIPLPLGVNQGGTGAIDAATARANLGVSAPITLPLGLSDGGTGGTDAATARASLGLSLPLAIGSGGTAGTSAATARANLGIPDFAIPAIASTAVLATTPISTAPEVVRMGYFSAGDAAPPTIFRGQTGTCTGNGYPHDLGRCVNTSGGNSWVAKPTNGVLEIMNFGCIGNYTADDTTCVSNFLAAVMYSQLAGHIAPGSYRVTSQLPAITQRIHIFGDGKTSGGAIYGDYNRAGNNGVLEMGNGSGGSVIENFAIETAPGTSGGSVISLINNGDPTTSTDGSHFRNLWLSTLGSNTHINTIYINGELKATGAVGVRDTDFDNVEVFGANGCSFYARSVVGLGFYGGSVNAAGGTNTQSGSICIEGTIPVPSQDVSLYPKAVNGWLWLRYTNAGVLDTPNLGSVIGVSVNNDGTVSNWRVRAPAVGQVYRYWSQSSFEGPDGVRKVPVTNGEYYVHPGAVVEYWKRVTASTINQTLSFDFNWENPPRCVGQLIDQAAGSRETADIANVTTNALLYSTSSGSSVLMDIRCIGVALNSFTVPGYP